MKLFISLLLTYSISSYSLVEIQYQTEAQHRAARQIQDFMNEEYQIPISLLEVFYKDKCELRSIYSAALICINKSGQLKTKKIDHEVIKDVLLEFGK